MHERSIAASSDCIWSAAVHIMSHACNLIAASSSHMQAPMQAYHACVEHMFNWELYVFGHILLFRREFTCEHDVFGQKSGFFG